MAVFRPQFGNENDYTGNKVLEFGFKGSNADFWAPVMIFRFYDPRGNPSKYQPIYIRMTSSFESSLIQGIDVATGIYSQPYATGGGLVDKIGTTFSGTIQAITKQILGGVSSVGGFVASGGTTGRQQIEFLSREVFNSFQQLIYQGPNFRQFSPAFTMRPVSSTEAESMNEIISRFKIASSPPIGTLGVSTGEVTTVNDQEVQTGTLRVTPTGEYVEGDLAFTFGYPEMCKFSIALVKGKADDNVKVFESDFCMIQSVAVTYGAQNKLTFFNGQAYPTDVNLQLQLREAVLQTRSNAVREFNGGLSIV